MHITRILTVIDYNNRGRIIISLLQVVFIFYYNITAAITRNIKHFIKLRPNRGRTALNPSAYNISDIEHLTKRSPSECLQSESRRKFKSLH